MKRAKAGCPDCADREKQKVLDDSLIKELNNRLGLAGKQAKHLIDNVQLHERHIEEKDRELAEATRVGEALTNDLRLKLDEMSETSRRLEEDLGGSVRELRSCQNDLLVAKEQVENLGRAKQYQEEQNRASLADLENKINVACMEDDTGKVQLSIEFHESVRTVGDLQSELTNEMRQYELIQAEVKRTTDSRDSIVEEKEKLEQRTVQYQRKLQRVSDANAITEKSMVRLTKESLALEYSASKAEKEVLALKKVIKQLEESAKGHSQKAGSSTDPGPESVAAKLSSEFVRAKAENASQQNVFSGKIDDIARTNDETLSKYVAQSNTLHAELLRFQNRQENSSEARSSQDATAPNPKREVSVASTARPMSPGIKYSGHPHCHRTDGTEDLRSFRKGRQV